MKLKVIKRFIDKDSKQLFDVDDVYETKDKKRAKFLEESGYVQDKKDDE